MKDCGCKDYELCPKCAPTPEAYEQATKFYWNSDKRVDPDKALEWLKKAAQED